MHIRVGISSELHRPTKDTVNHFKKPVEIQSAITCEEVNIISSDVKMTPNPAYAAP